MTPFLESIAQHFYSCHKEELHRYRFFMPNRRSGIFFMHYLRRQMGDEVLFAPRITTLNEYISTLSALVEGEELILIFEMYKVYCELSSEKGVETTFEQFYPIGELILSDFRDIDKHLVNAEKLFTNLYELKEIEGDLSFLDEVQREAISGFLRPIPVRGEETKAMLKSFLDFWANLYPLYTKFRQNIKAKGLAYDGMLVRELCEDIKSETAPTDKSGYINVFVGLNALTPCEHIILRHFKSTTETLFYWDYESEPLRGKGLAAYFRERNLSDYPEPDGADEVIRPQVSLLPEIEVTAIPSAVAQTAYIGNRIKELHYAQPDLLERMRVAIVLPNERMLIPMLNNIPSEVEHLNVTMGYPVRETPLVALLELLLGALHRALAHEGSRRSKWRGEDVLRILSMSTLAPFLSDIREHIGRDILTCKLLYLSPDDLRSIAKDNVTSDHKEACKVIETLFCRIPTDGEDGVGLFDYFIRLLRFLMEHHPDRNKEEADQTTDETPTELFSAEKTILPRLTFLLEEMRHNLLGRLTETPDLPLTSTVATDVLTTIFRNARIPYAGEPLKGLQMMGMLETRSLDFDMLFIPDASEGLLPQKRYVQGIVPYSLRIGYNMPTYEWQERTRAYNFFRLISRASKVVMTYDSRKNDVSDGEPSRYIRMLDYIHHARITYHTGAYPLFPLDNISLSDDLNTELVDRFRRSITDPNREMYLSPSRINSFLTCPRQFYYTVICGLSDGEDLQTRVETRELGTIIHGTLEVLYKVFLDRFGGFIDKEQLRYWLKEGDGVVRKELLRQFYKVFYGKEEGPELTGYNLIQYGYALDQVRNVLQKDNAHKQRLLYVGGEMRFTDQLLLPSGKEINIKGIIDRVDLEGECLRVIDYKTGRDRYEINTLGNHKANDLNTAAIQLLFYCMILSRMSPDHPFLRLLPPFTSLRPIINKPIHRSHLGLLVFTSDPKGDITDFEQVREWYEGFILPVLDEIVSEQQIFAPRPSPKCYYCPARRLCKAGAYIDPEI